MLRLRPFLATPEKLPQHAMFAPSLSTLSTQMLAERNDPFRQVEVQDSRLSDERLITRSFVDRLVVEKFGKPCPVPAVDATEQPFDKSFWILGMKGSDVHTRLTLRHQ